MLVSSCDGETEQSDLGVLPPEHRHLRVSPHPAAPGPPQLPLARGGKEPGGWDEQVEHPAAGGTRAAAGVDEPLHLPRTTTTLLYSTWRSGSSFLGGVFEASPQVMYIYEPFQDYGVKIIRYTITNVLVSG